MLASKDLMELLPAVEQLRAALSDAASVPTIPEVRVAYALLYLVTTGMVIYLKSQATEATPAEEGKPA